MFPEYSQIAGTGRCNDGPYSHRHCLWQSARPALVLPAPCVLGLLLLLSADLNPSHPTELGREYSTLPVQQGTRLYGFVVEGTGSGMDLGSSLNLAIQVD